MSDAENQGWVTLTLDGEWSLSELPLAAEGDAGHAILARGDCTPIVGRVPGDVHLDLMRIGRMDDPSFGDNARTRCRWPEQRSWWYRRELVLPDGFRDHMDQRLVFDAIDLYAQIFVNGHLAGTSKNAFTPVELDLQELLKDGTNELAVRVTSGMELAPEPSFVGDFGAFFSGIDELYKVRSWDQRRPLRKADYSAYGHDWCDPLPNIGICGSVRIEGRSGVVISDVRVDTVIAGSVWLEGEVVIENLHPWSETPAVLEISLVAPNGAETATGEVVNAQPGRSSVRCRIDVEEPELWWPNGFGEQPLYTLKVRVVTDGKETDRWARKVGLRTIELIREPLSTTGSRFGFRVNGQDVFCKGGNWAPADLITVRATDDRYEQLVADARSANFTMLRVNGVGVYERDAFYDACDRAGILVWQDFTFSDAMYPDSDAAFVELVRAEAEAVVKRLRHHASLALWCGNNECALSMVLIWQADPAHPKQIGGVTLYNRVLPDICRLYDPRRPYWPSSPSGGRLPNSEQSGDVHGMGALDFKQEARRLEWRTLADRSTARFYSETFNLFAPPSMTSVREYLDSEDIRLDSTNWRIHVNVFDDGVTEAGIRDHYGGGESMSVEDFVLYGQLYQALLVANAVEAARFRKSDPIHECLGMLTWSFNETWGEVGWGIVDHYGRHKAGYYAFRRSATPVKVIVRSRDQQLVTRVINDTPNAHDVSVQFGWMRLDGEAAELQERQVIVPANGMAEIATVDEHAARLRDAREWLYAARLEGPGLDRDQCVWPLAPHRELAVVDEELRVTEHDGVLEITSGTYQHGVHLDDEGEGLLADNYFDLLPGVSAVIPIRKPAVGTQYRFRAIAPLHGPRNG